MADYYVASDATGTGNGSIGSPWTLDQAVAAQGTFPQPSVVWITSGNYDLTTPISFTRPTIAWIGTGVSKPVLRYIGSAAYTSTFVTLAAQDQILQGVVVDGNYLVGNITNVSGSSRIHECDIRNLLDKPGYARPWANSGRISRCRCYNTQTNGYFYIDSVQYINSLVDARIGGGGVANSVGGSAISSVFCEFSAGVSNVPVTNSIFIGCGSTVAVGHRGFIDGLIAINCSTVMVAGSYNGCSARNVYSYGHGTLYTGTWNELTNVNALPFNPFVDHANLDFRLTEQAKDSQYANGLRAILASLQSVPGITLDSLDELYPPLLEPSFSSTPTFSPSPPIAGRPLRLFPGTATTTAVDREWVVYDEDGDPEENYIAATSENEVLLPASSAGKEIVVQETITTADGKSASSVASGIAVSSVGTTGVPLRQIVSARTTTARTSTVK